MSVLICEVMVKVHLDVGDKLIDRQEHLDAMDDWVTNCGYDFFDTTSAKVVKTEIGGCRVMKIGDVHVYGKEANQR